MTAAKEPTRSRTYRDTAVVLRTYKLGEADRILVAMTARHGKVRAVAKGVRKPTSRLAALVEATGHIDASFYRGRGDLDTLTQAQSVDSYTKLRQDYDRLTRALSFVEAVDHVTPDREPNERLFSMLVGALGLVNGDNPTLTSAGFFLKLLSLEGFEPIFDRCIGCGALDGLVAVDPVGGGTRCSACRRGIAITEEAVGVCRLILGGGLGAALALPESPGLDQINRMAATLVEFQIDRKLKSLNSV